MTNLEKRLKLANEAKSLIIEFRNEESRISENLLNDVSISEDGTTIYIDDKSEGQIEYDLTEVSAVFTAEMRGWGGPCPAIFYDAVAMVQSELEDEYKSMKKDEFIQYVGGLYYMEYRCEEIYKRLQEIENEAEALEK